MDAHRFADLVDAYGAAIERWPVHERDAARALLEQSEPARRRLQEGAALDDAFALLPPPPPPSAALRRRVLAAAPEARVVGLWASLRALWGDLGGVRTAGPVMATAIALGVALTPLGMVPGGERIGDDELLQQIAFAGDDFEDWLP